MQRRTTIRAAYAHELARAAYRFRDHEGMSREHVLDWLARFDDADLELAVRVLQETRYYSGPDIRRMAENLVTLIRRHLRGTNPHKIFYVPVGDASRGAAVLARALTQVPGVRRERVKLMVELENVPPADIGAIVFVDDFSGTGQTLTDWWNNVEMLVRPKGAPVIVGLLVLNRPARERIEKFASALLRVEELGRERNVLAPECLSFQDPEKQTLVDYCRRTGCNPEYERGRGACGLLIAFRHLCPNNSLPILWHESKHWTALFKRRAI